MARVDRLLEQQSRELERLLEASGAVPDTMPLDAGVKTELPEESIR